MRREELGICVNVDRGDGHVANVVVQSRDLLDGEDVGRMGRVQSRLVKDLVDHPVCRS